MIAIIPMAVRSPPGICNVVLSFDSCVVIVGEGDAEGSDLGKGVDVVLLVVVTLEGSFVVVVIGIFSSY